MSVSRSGFHGIYPMLYAFFQRDGQLDRGAMVRQVDACIAGGAHGIAILGLATEVGKLDVRERCALLDCVAEAVDGRVPQAVTVAEASISGQVEFARAAAAAGAAWAILQPPPLPGVAEAQWVEFFSAVAEQVSLPLAIQNAPGLIANSLSATALMEIHRRAPHLCLLKGEGPATYVRDIVVRTEGCFDVFNGYGGLQLPNSVRAGCAGLIPGAECFDVQARIYALMRSDDPADHAAGDALHAELLPLIVFLMSSVENMIAYGKRLAARRLGLGTTHDRPPASPVSAFGLDCLERLGAALPPLP